VLVNEHFLQEALRQAARAPISALIL